MDAFSQILSGVQLTGAVFFSAEFSAPWGLTTPTAKAMAATAGLGVEYLVLYHLVIEGGAVIELFNGERTELSAGDVVVFPHGDPHHMSKGAGERPRGIVQGATVLFPFRNESAYQNHRFFKSLAEVQIGGLPFLPGATTLAENYIRGILKADGYLA